MNRIIKLAAITSLVLAAANSSATAPAQVPVTGETGTVPGSTSGVAWPSSRFVAGSGVTANCITDKLTGLMWPKNGVIAFIATSGGGLLTQPDYTNTDPTLNMMNWNSALIAVTNMNSAPAKLCGFSDWRLPNRVELKSMVNYGALNPATWLNSSGFSLVQANTYWSSSISKRGDSSWGVYLAQGSVSPLNRTLHYYVWPVRLGQ